MPPVKFRGRKGKICLDSFPIPEGPQHMVYPHRGFAGPSWLEGGYDKKNKKNKETAAFYKTSRCSTGRPTKLERVAMTMHCNLGLPVGGGNMYQLQYSDTPCRRQLRTRCNDCYTNSRRSLQPSQRYTREDTYTHTHTHTLVNFRSSVIALSTTRPRNFKLRCSGEGTLRQLRRVKISPA